MEEDVLRQLLDIMVEFDEPERIELGGIEATMAHRQQIQDAAAAIRTALDAGRGLTDNESERVMLALQGTGARLAAVDAAIKRLAGDREADA